MLTLGCIGTSILLTLVLTKDTIIFIPDLDTAVELELKGLEQIFYVFCFA